MAKKSQPSPDSVAESGLASAIQHLTDMLGIVDETLRDIKDELAWIINNRDEFPVLNSFQESLTEIHRQTPAKPERIACTDCDTESPPSLTAALQGGWSELAPHDGPGWNYIGLCPTCLENEYSLDNTKPEVPLPEPNNGDDQDEPGKSQGTLF